MTNYSVSESQTFYHEFRLEKYKNIKMGIDSANAIEDYFKITGVPFIAVYDRNKKLKSVFSGHTSAENIEEVSFN